PSGCDPPAPAVTSQPGCLRSRASGVCRTSTSVDSFHSLLLPAGLPVVVALLLGLFAVDVLLVGAFTCPWWWCVLIGDRSWQEEGALVSLPAGSGVNKSFALVPVVGREDGRFPLRL
ncbi:unnamed protein product, partial [Ectocarpus sp. 6 AP-2014]